MDRQYRTVLRLGFGKMGVRVQDEYLIGLEFLPAETPEVPAQDPLTREVQRQLEAWCADAAFVFDLPCRSEGSVFQKSVWREISATPLGTTRTYAQLASSLGTSPRAVGNACGRNPLPIIVPCHRIVSRSGLGGFNQGRIDWLLHTKRWLLNHESGAAAFELLGR